MRYIFPMNVAFPTPSQLERHKFTVDDVLEMTAAGLIDKRVELLDGEIYDMPAEGGPHTRLAMRLGRMIGRVLEDSYFVGVQATLRLSAGNAPSPDIFVLRGDLPDGDVPTDNVLLVIEVADTSLKDDLTDSASRYARHGVRDYWVVDANARIIYVHRDPKDGVYPEPRKFAAADAVAPLLISELSVTLNSIPGLDAV